MAQYVTYTNNQYRYHTDPDTLLLCRTGQRDHLFVEDAELVANGFALAENTGWENILSHETVAGVGMRFREGVRSNEYVIDVETSSNVWENINGAE